jgi:hypothetical protein
MYFILRRHKKIIKILHSNVFVFASLLHIKIHKNMWAHEGPHISEKPKKEVGT